MEFVIVSWMGEDTGQLSQKEDPTENFDSK